MKWIKTSEQLPEYNKELLIIFEDIIHVAEYGEHGITKRVILPGRKYRSWQFYPGFIPLLECGHPDGIEIDQVTYWTYFTDIPRPNNIEK